MHQEPSVRADVNILTADCREEHLVMFTLVHICKQSVAFTLKCGVHKKQFIKITSELKISCNEIFHESLKG